MLRLFYVLYLQNGVLELEVIVIGELAFQFFELSNISLTEPFKGPLWSTVGHIYARAIFPECTLQGVS